MNGRSGFYTRPVVLLIPLMCVLQMGCNSQAKYWEKETKANLHDIQQQLERFKSDAGEYPDYLLGGSTDSWRIFHERGGDPELFDPLIISGYFSEYPENPFASRQTGQRYIAMTGGSSDVEGSGDPRFGLDGKSMANILDDPTYFSTLGEEYAPTINQKGNPEIFNYGSFGGIPDEYDRPELNIIPGCFYYRAVGDIIVPDSAKSGRHDRTEYYYRKNTIYILGAYGSAKNTGEDVLRLTGTGDYERPKDLPFNFSVPLLLPEACGHGEAGANPFFPYVDDGEFLLGAPDGYRDGIILILTSVGITVDVDELREKK